MRYWLVQVKWRKQTYGDSLESGEAEFRLLAGTRARAIAKALEKLDREAQTTNVQHSSAALTISIIPCA
jgi:hypothetical protein